MHQSEFSFERSRGIVWVCDLAESSKHLNDDATAADLEAFLPRLHWLGMVAVKAAGGVFLKWTGDGFLAWFETPLHRELSQKARKLFEAVWHLTFTVNVTQLGIAPERKFRLRHGIAYEHDALLTKITNSAGHESLDIAGRGVVLAFRLSGVRTEFPGLTSDANVAKAAQDAGLNNTHFKRWCPNREELLRYFKGERWGTRNLVISVARKPRKNSLQATVKKSKKLISKIEQESPEELMQGSFASLYTEEMSQGPNWVKEVLAEELRFLQDDVLETLKVVTGLVSEKVLETKA